MGNNGKFVAYVGTYTNGESKGIYRLKTNEEGKIEEVRLAAEIENPTYLTISNDNKYLYSVIKIGELGGVAAFSIDPSTGELKLINYQVSKGSAPCHVSLDSENKYVFSANYHRGIIEVLPIREDGGICPPSSIISHEGSGPNKDRQESAHVHYAALNPDEKYLCAVDLGIDKVAVYSFKDGLLIEEKELSTSLRPGCGPRHMVFHPNGILAYVITELSNEIIILQYSKANNSFKEVGLVSTLPKDYVGESFGSAIHISSDGRYLYAGNRGHDSIAVFKIDPSTGMIELVAHTSTEGLFPRDFALAPGERFVLAANQNSSDIVTFEVDKETGGLTKAWDEISVPNPVCIKFLNESTRK